MRGVGRFSWWPTKGDAIDLTDEGLEDAASDAVSGSHWITDKYDDVRRLAALLRLVRDAARNEREAAR